MSLSVGITVATPSGFDLTTLTTDFAEGDYVTHPAGLSFATFGHETSLFTAPPGFDPTAGELESVVIYNEGVAAVIRFSEPLIFDGTAQELAQMTTGDWMELALEAVLDSPVIFNGGRGDDHVTGGALDDILRGRGGNDFLIGQGGIDQLVGGRGDDALDGGADNDRLQGGADNDLLVTGQGSDRAGGGSGNDLFVDTGNGDAQWFGGTGADIFVIGQGGEALTAQIDGFVPTEGSGRTVITDFSSDDVLIFSGVQTTASGSPQGIWTDLRPGATLADWDGAGADSFDFRDTANGLEMVWGDEILLLQGLAAKDVALDQVHFGGNWIDVISTDFADFAYSPAGSTMQVATGPDASQVIAGLDGDIFNAIMFETFTTFGAETGL